MGKNWWYGRKRIETAEALLTADEKRHRYAQMLAEDASTTDKRFAEETKTGLLWYTPAWYENKNVN